MAKIVIVGGGPSGLSCALALESARGMPGMPELSVVLLDDAKSDLTHAELHNAPGIARGTPGAQVLASLRSQVESFGGAELRTASVESVQSSGHEWTVVLQDGESIVADVVVLAAGYKAFHIQVPGLEIKTIPHPASPKPRTAVLCGPDGLLAPGLWVTGTLAGHHSMFSVCAGAGVETACRILGSLTGQPTHIHDVPGSRKH